MKKDIAQLIVQDLDEVRRQKPLLHHITNFVVMNETANVTLCIGALPVMAHAREEVEEMVRAARALILNIGTLTPELIESMTLAGRVANELNIPIILDPVGVGATSLRIESARHLIKSLKIDVIRGNSAEISILAGYGGRIKGVESIGGLDNMLEIVKEFAFKRDCVVAVTGKEDLVSDGRSVALVGNGDPMLSMVTGTGCMATTLIGAFAAVQKDRFLATVGGLVAFGLAGEIAARESGVLPGTFHVALYNSLACLSSQDILSGCRVRMA